MATQKLSTSLFRFVKPSVRIASFAPIQIRGKASSVQSALKSVHLPSITSAVPALHNTAKVIFDNAQTADFKYIWLRDNCQCSMCIHPATKQKLVDTPSIDINVKPKSLLINSQQKLEVVWDEPNGKQHSSVYDKEWLYKYGQSFIHNTFETDNTDKDHHGKRPELQLWTRTEIWSSFPEVSYKEFMGSDEGLKHWLEMFYKYGVAVLRGVPTEEHMITEVVKRFAYVKETQYGLTFDVVNKPQVGSHLAYTGVHLTHHTDMNYREKSPGMQMLHCLKANNPKELGVDPGGRSFFADGFRVAKWMEENAPAAFHILASTPVRFSIKNDGMTYSARWPIICLEGEEDVSEIHYNNRTMKPLQAPTHVVTPFYHAYKLFAERLQDSSNNLEFQMLPGDLVAFNNRRVLHGRTQFDPTIVNRHLKGCYVDIDEAFSKLDQLLA